MAYMITDSKPSITKINAFLGLNLNETGETQLKLGEASLMKNFRITKDYKLSKMFGYEYLYTTGKEIRVNYVGKLGTNEVNVYISNRLLYDKGVYKGAILGTYYLLFEWDKNLYILNSNVFKIYNGSIFADAKGYVPTIKTACTPAGVGTDLEQINMLSMYRKVLFSGDGSSTEYHLPETELDADTKVKINGVQTLDFSINTTTGVVTITTPPPAGTNNVEIEYKKPASIGDVKKCRYCQKFGLADDTRLFTYGDPDHPNRVYFSDLDITGVGNPLYFPANNFIDVGSSNEPVTDISRQYDRLIVSKPNECYYMVYEPITDLEGNTIITFPTYPLNKSHGMVAYSQGQLLDNYVTTIDASGIIQWLSTNTKDERNANVISGRINEWLLSKDLTKAVTMDYQEEKEYWLAIDNEVMIYNYANNTFYLLELPDNVRTLSTYKNEIYMGTDKGIVKFGKNKTAYAGTPIKAKWESGFYDFDAEYKRKTMRVLWFALKPQEKTYMRVNYISDRNSGTEDKEIQQETFSYNYFNYNDFTYESGVSVKPFRIKLKAKKFAFLKLIIENDKLDYKLIVDSISIQKAYGGNVK